MIIPFAAADSRSTYNLLACRSESEPVQLPVQHSIAVSAKEALDLTATFTLAEAIHKSSCLLKELRSVAKSPQRLEAALEGSLHGRTWGHASVCRLQNDTGLPVQCWLGPTLHPDPKTPGEWLNGWSTPCITRAKRLILIGSLHTLSDAAVTLPSALHRWISVQHWCATQGKRVL